MPALGVNYKLLMIWLILSVLTASSIVEYAEEIIEPTVTEVIEFPYGDEYVITPKMVDINTKQYHYSNFGKYINKDVSNINISEIFTDFEILTILKRIEGYYDSSSRIAISHNNPCNLKYGSLPKKYGAKIGKQEVFYGEGDYYAYFPNIEKGNDACIELISRMKKKYPTVRKFFTRWSSIEGGNIYTTFVNNLMNVDNYPLDYHGTTY